MQKTNYHTHTARCRHAVGTEEEYILSALKEGFSLLGFSDHGPFPFGGGYVPPMRMGMDELADYLSAVEALQKEYAGRVEIVCGLEYEYFPAFLSTQQKLLEEGRVSYFLFGNHYDLDERGGIYFGRCLSPAHIERYVVTSIQGMETGLFSCFAHPDLYLHSYPVFDRAAEKAARELCACARALDIPLEYNLLGLKKQESGVPGLGYPCGDFWRVAAQEGCSAVIGVDAHAPSMFSGEEYDRACAALEALGIRRVERLAVR